MVAIDVAAIAAAIGVRKNLMVIAFCSMRFVVS